MSNGKSLLLRSFYYLDSKMVDDFISAIDGGIENDTITEKTKNEKGAEAGLKVPIIPVSASGNVATSKEVEKTMHVVSSYPAKFQRMMEYLHDEISFYDTCDDEIMKTNMQRNSIIEIEGKIRFSKVDEIMGTIKQLLPIIGSIQSAGGDVGIDQDTVAGIKLIDNLVSTNKSKGIPTVLEFDDESKLQVVFHLNESYFQVERNSIPSPVTVFCKVQKYIKHGEKYELINILPALEKIAFNREQRLAMKKNIDEFPKEIRDVIKGPAIIVTPIAMYN